jgi:guanylate kinase
MIPSHLIIISSPSGAGKSSITQGLLQQDNRCAVSVSATTRAPRPGETDGIHYHFLSHTNFDQAVKKNDFLEHATVFKNSYGTLKSEVEKLCTDGKDVVFDVDWQGARQLKQNATRPVITIFIHPPSLQALERRLVKRQQDSAAQIAYRMSMAQQELDHANEYTYHVVNHDLSTAINDVRAIIRAERLKTSP